MDEDRDSNAAYYRNRAEMERTMAEQAPNDDIRKVHAELADRYAERANEFEERNPPVPSSAAEAS